MPELPWRELVVEQLHVFRECTTGSLRDVRISGILHKTGASADGTVVFQSAGSTAYRLTFAGSHPGSLDATLQTEPVAPSPIVSIQSHVHQGPSDVQIEGRASTDFAQLPPFLDLVLPLGVDLHNIAGTLQATWTVTAPPAASLATAWRAPTAVVAGTAALTLTLPKFAGVGDNVSVRFNGEVTGNAEQLAWTLSQLEVQLGVDVVYLDVFSLMQAIQAQPSRFGFEDAFQSFLLPDGTTRGPDPDAFLSWDHIHPTARAHELLTETRMSVTQVAAALGYADVAYFSRQYKRHTGRPPSAEREPGGSW